VTGAVRERITLASGRYAMIDDGLEFSLVSLDAVAQQSDRQAYIGRDA
jgi:hypothetical protein